jgi:hypothetical protein
MNQKKNPTRYTIRNSEKIVIDNDDLFLIFSLIASEKNLSSFSP